MRDFRETSIVERLRIMSDDAKEEYWPKRTIPDSQTIWRVPVGERFFLLPPSERRIRSRCCCEIVSGIKGQEPTCHGCGRVVNNIPEPVVEDRAANAYVQGADE
jgi:hypothetical protein